MGQERNLTIEAGAAIQLRPDHRWSAGRSVPSHWRRKTSAVETDDVDGASSPGLEVLIVPSLVRRFAPDIRPVGPRLQIPRVGFAGAGEVAALAAGLRVRARFDPGAGELLRARLVLPGTFD